MRTMLKVSMQVEAANKAIKEGLVPKLVQETTEAIVALAVAVVFVLLSFGAIAREQGQRPGRSGHNAYIAASNVNLSQVAASETDVLGIY